MAAIVFDTRFKSVHNLYTLKPSLFAKVWIVRPIWKKSCPGLQTAIAASRHFFVTSIKRNPFSSTSPQGNVRQVSPWNPSAYITKSTFTISPFSRTVSSGIAWHTTSFTLIEILFGKPSFPRQLG